MRLLVINPNTTAAMTDAIGAAARDAATDPGLVTAVNPTTGPTSIQGPEDGAAALPGLYDVFEREIVSGDRYDAVIIACFDDTGLWELREHSPVPVVGIGEAGYHAGMLFGPKFSVVTTLAVSVPVLETNLETYGFAARCSRVRASGVPVLETDQGGDTEGRIRDEVAAAFAEDDVASVVLGCAGMAGLAERMTAHFGKPVIDGVAAAVRLCALLANARTGLSSRGVA
ncbi:MAG: aspartate/glutamate racemase family protein [Pseudomonadota bacterium]